MSFSDFYVPSFLVERARRAAPPIFGGSVTANIGWYVISILHDWPPCNIDITWPSNRDYGSNVQLFWGGFRSGFFASILVSILHDWNFM